MDTLSSTVLAFEYKIFKAFFKSPKGGNIGAQMTPSIRAMV